VNTIRKESSLQELLGSRFYWLCRCEGFRVESPEGRFGLVEAVMFRVRPDEPDALIVRAGVLGRKLVIVPIEDVADIVPRRERVMLKRVPDFSGADFLTDVRTRLRRLAAEGAAGQGGLALGGGSPLPEA
jgi:hypothetical protein